MAVLSVIVVSYNTAALLHDCINSILTTSDIDSTEIIVVDNASVDDSVAMVRRMFPAVRLLVQNENLGFGAANNVGVAASSTPYVMLLNSDAILLGNTATSLIRYLEENPGVSCVGPRIVLPNGQRQRRAFGNLPTVWRIAMQSFCLGLLVPRVAAFEGVDGGDRQGPEDEVGWLTGVCMVMRRLDFVTAGGFDPTIFMYCEDIDLCWRLSEGGRKIVRLDDHRVLHFGGGSSPSTAAQLRNSRLQQSNLLKIVKIRSGRLASNLAAILIFPGLALRVVAGVCFLPIKGLRQNMMLLSSWFRILDLVKLSRL
jgi:GT2 family glycosyltransferase